MCVDCGHTLTVRDLVPVLSWVALHGKCRYCKKPVSWQYPLIELATALLFMVSYVLWPNQLNGWEIAAFAAWLACIVGFMALIVYDLRWLLLPNKIIFPLYGAAAVFVLARTFGEMSFQPVVQAAAGVAIGGGIFYLLFQISGGKWIGGGDVKLGFLLGALVGGPLPAFLLLFTASVLGSLLAVPLLIAGKAGRRTRIPFGPFLITGAIVTQLFGTDIIRWYTAMLML